MKKLDFIIVGQGLAGTNLAFHLLDKKMSFVIIDEWRNNTSSKIAAGLMNPITGRRFAKTWMAEHIFPYAKKYYQNLEVKLGNSFYHEMPIYRYFGSIEDQNTWMGRSIENDIKPFVGQFNLLKTKGINHDFGGAEIKYGGWLNTTLFLETANAFFTEKKLIINQQFNFNDLDIENSIYYNEIEASKIVFCEGYRVINNPFFNQLPFTFAKGEVLEISSDNIENEVIHNKNGFILPLQNNRFKVGATFRWNEMDENITQRSLTELKEKLQKLTSQPYSILSQKASIRPTTKDRRPFVGAHPSYKNVVCIFNGFGSKGVTLTPYFSDIFLSHLIKGENLPAEIDISRFF